MTVEGAVQANHTRRTSGAHAGLVANAPASADRDSPDKLSAARGIALGVGVCAVFWGAVATAVVLVSN